MTAEFVSCPMASIDRGAAALGVTQPALFILPDDSARARDILNELKSERTPSVTLNASGDAPMYLVSREHACLLLRRNASSGGNYTADVVEKFRQLDFWSIAILKDGIRVGAIIGGVEIHGFVTGYETVTPWPYYEIRKIEGHVVRVDSPDGGHVDLTGRTGHDALVAAGFVESILEGRMELPSNGRMVSVTLDDDTLASALLRLSHKPHVIAEAIMALRKLGTKDRWVTRVLRNRPSLSELATKVRNSRAISLAE